MQPLFIMARLKDIIKNCYYCIKYPFLNPYPDRRFFPRYTYLDDMPIGWKKAFGLQLCKELKEALLRVSKDYLRNYRVVQVKEKFGRLNWYDSGSNVETNKILHKYEEISWHTCCKCGRPATVISQGWICPYCDDCKPFGSFSNFGLKDYPFYGWTGNVNYRDNWTEIEKEYESHNK